MRTFATLVGVSKYAMDLPPVQGIVMSQACTLVILGGRSGYQKYVLHHCLILYMLMMPTSQLYVRTLILNEYY